IETLEGRCLPSNSQYISALYQSLLDRTPTPAEASGWVNFLNNGGSPQQVALGFVNSREYWGILARADYQTLLGRNGSEPEVTHWVAELMAGLHEDQMTAGFLTSAEYSARSGGTDTAWLTTVYRDVLGRAPDAAGLNGWAHALQAGTSRGDVALKIVDSQ